MCTYVVMLNFMCQLDWATGRPEVWLNFISGCVCKGVCGWDYNWTGRLRKADCSPQCGWASSNLLKTWTEFKEERRGDFELFDWSGTLGFSYPQTGMSTIGFPGSQAFRLWLTKAGGFLGSSTCREQIIGLNTFQNCMSQFLIFFLSICLSSTSYWFCFFGEP